MSYRLSSHPEATCQVASGLRQMVELLPSCNCDTGLAVTTQSAGDPSCFCNDGDIRIYRDVVVKAYRELAFGVSKSPRAT